MHNPVLREFVDKQVSRAVVRLSHRCCPVATGFFVTRRGHILTAFHAVKAFWPFEPEFDLTITSYSKDPAEADWTVGRSQTVRVTFRACGPVEEDWALLASDLDPPARLPLGSIAAVREMDDVWTYGFAAGDQPGQAMSALKGYVSHLHKPHSQFDLTYLPRGKGHSGGPLYHLGSHTVVGLTRGLHVAEHLSDVGKAVHFQSMFALCPELAGEFEEVRREWRADLTAALAAKDKRFPPLQPVPAPPEEYVPQEDILKQAERELEERGAVLLHGGPGTGKSTLLADLAARLKGPAGSGTRCVFWHDFAAAESTALEPFVRELSLFLAREASEFEPLASFLEDSTDGRPGSGPGPGSAGGGLDGVVHLVTDKIHVGKHVLCLDNLHVAQRGGGSRLISFIRGLIRGTGAARLVLASWDELDSLVIRPLGVNGFNPEEAKAYLRLFGGLRAGPEVERAIGEAATNIEVFKLWLREALAGKASVDDLFRNPPADLQRYIRTKYVKHWTPAERSVLLGFSVFGRPVEPDLVEAVARVEDFPGVFTNLRTSPPLLDKKGVNLFEPHSLVRQAVLEASASERRVRMQTRAGRELAAREQFLGAASQYLDARKHLLALRLFDDHAETILSRGQVRGVLDHLGAIEKAIPRSRDGADPRRRLLLIRADCEEFCGRYEDAVGSYRRSLEWTDQDEQKARVEIRLGNCFRLWSKYDEARSAYDTASRLTSAARSVEGRTTFGRALLGRAKLDRLACRYPHALQAYRQALDVFDGLLDVNGRIEAHFGFGEVYRLRHEYDRAWDEYQKSQELAAESGNRHRAAFAAWGLGEIHRLRGNYPEAETAHEAGRQFMADAGERRSEGWAYLGLAEVWRARGQLDRAEEGFREAIRLCADTGSMTEVGHATLGLAEVARCRGRPDSQLYQRAEDIYRRLGLHHCLVLLLIGKALASTADDPGSSRALLAEAAALCDTHQLEPERLRIKSLQEQCLDASRQQLPEANPLNFP